MSKSSGLGDHLFIDGVDVSGDINSLSRIGGSVAALDMTGINKYAFERRGGVRDGSIEFTSYFNPSEGETHDVLSALPTSNRVVSYHRGLGVGAWSAHVVAKQIGYDPTRAADGALTNVTAAQANGFGLEWARQLTDGKRVDSQATDGDSFDLGAGSSFGLQAYLHVFALDGDDATITLQHSADDGDADPFTDLASFTEVTAAPSAERIETARAEAVERYLRVVTSGTFSELVFAVSVAVNPVEVRF